MSGGWEFKCSPIQYFLHVTAIPCGNTTAICHEIQLALSSTLRILNSTLQGIVIPFSEADTCPVIVKATGESQL